MYVKIGKYPPTRINCNLLANNLDKKYGHKWPSYDQYTKYDKVIKHLDDLIQNIYNATINKLIKNKNRKIIIRIDPQDVWNVDNTLAYIILPILKKLKESKHGSPFVDDEDVPDELKSTSAEPKENTWDIDSNHHKRWAYVLDEMIFAFEAEVNHWEEPDDGDTYTNKYYRNADRVSTGFKLFGKYYSSLWT